MAKTFDKFKSLFVVTQEVDESKNKVEEQNKAEAEKKSTSEKKVEKTEAEQQNRTTSKMSWKTTSNGETTKTEVESNNVVINSENQSGEFSQKIFDQLTKAIYEANLPGEDYLEFMDALNAMKNLQLDEKIKLQTVFATLSTKGLTKEKIIESADYYLKVLDNERSKFYEVLNNHMKGQVNSKLSEITKLESSVKEKEELILTLQEEIKQTKQVILKVKNEIQQADGKIKKTENDFQITYEIIASNLRNTVEKIKQI